MAASNVITNYSNGWVIEVIPDGSVQCESWLLMPAENLWSEGVRGFLYIVAMLYVFIGIAIVSDIFMCSIEVITSKKRTIVRWDEEKQERIEREVLIWNETVANLTLMALGSSAPEIMLATIETISNLGNEGADDGLGTFTIIGSAAFNLLIICAVCIISVPKPNIKRIREVGVFMLTSVWSIFAYAWMLIVLEVTSPGVIEVWEAWLTFAFFPIMVITAYCQDSGWWCKRAGAVGVDQMSASHTNVRIVNQGGHSMMHGMSRELAALEKERVVGMSRTSLHTITEKNDEMSLQPVPGRNSVSDCTPMGSMSRLTKERPGKQGALAHARFRHAAVRSMLGGRKHTAQMKTRMADVVIANSRKEGLGPNGDGFKFPPDEELVGKFTFASPSYSVLESAGILEIDVLFHRRPPTKSRVKLLNGGKSIQGNGLAPPGDNKETSFAAEDDDDNMPDVHTGVVTVEFETREGSGKIDKDFVYTNGSLVFKETEYRKTITVPIINDNQYEADVDFYVILKNAKGDAGLSDPNITRVTIIDDDEPGEFQFDEPHVYADLKTGTITATVIRQKGCDGNVTIEYSTINGTAIGGDEIEGSVDYISAFGELHFKHGETSRPICIDINKEALGSKNFIITLRNPSIGAKIGQHSATVANITSDDLDDRLAGVVDDEDEELTWSETFRGAMVLEAEQDEDGKDVPLQWYDFVLHFLTFLWKIIFAFIPPRRYLGAWPAFFVSLIFIGILTAIVEQLGSLLSCVIGLKSSVAGITIIALGTSLPDTFASRTAALHDEHADAAIGNVTGSNSVNVFLGLGLPWVISAMYAYAKDRQFLVSTTDLIESVVIFTIVGSICIVVLLIRRFAVGGELGGKSSLGRYGSSIFLTSLWVLYITLSSIKAYHPSALPW